MERDSDLIFGADQASDGMLRVIQLWTLLLMPTDWFPAVLIVDEPELGLYPTAIVQLCGMLRSASRHCQVILATQSVRMVDEFYPDNIVVVERPRRESIFTQKNEAELGEWLKEYSLGQLWEKNILGGKPQ
jgi:predicted ATPase